jgi:heat shock protein HtpX
MAYRIVTLFAFIAAVFSATGFLIAGALGSAIGLILSAAVIAYLYWLSPGMLLRLFRARPADKKELTEMMERLSLNAKIRTPKIYVIATEAPNSLAVGMSWKNAAICVTEGLLTLDNDEIEAVVSHELGHMKRRDAMIATAATAIAYVVSWPAQKIYLSTFYKDRKSKLGYLLIAFIGLFAIPAAAVLRLSISKAIEYRADFFAAFNTQKPKKLASALNKINDVAKHNPMPSPVATSQLWIVNPFRDDWFSNLFDTDPPTAKRVKRLSDMAHEGLAEHTKVWE